MFSVFIFLRIQVHLFANSVTISYNTKRNAELTFTQNMYISHAYVSDMRSFLEPLLPKVILAFSYIYSISIPINHEHSRTFMTFGFNSISEYSSWEIYSGNSFVVIFLTHDVCDRLVIFSSWKVGCNFTLISIFIYHITYNPSWSCPWNYK